MQNTRKSGQILRSENRPRPTLRSGRGSRTNSNTSHQIPARVIEADSARAVWAPDPRLAQLIQPGAAAAVITVPSMAWACRPATIVDQQLGARRRPPTGLAAQYGRNARRVA